MTQGAELEQLVWQPNAKGWFIAQIRQSHSEGGLPHKWIVTLSDGKYLSAWGEADTIAQALALATADIEFVLKREALFASGWAQARPMAKPTPAGTLSTADLFAKLGLKPKAGA